MTLPYRTRFKPENYPELRIVFDETGPALTDEQWRYLLERVTRSMAVPEHRDASRDSGIRRALGI